MSLVERIGAHARAEQDRLLASSPAPSSEDLLDGIRSRRAREKRAVRQRSIGAAGVLLAALALFLFFGRGARSGPVRAPALGVATASNDSVPLSFEDGTTIVLRRGAKADLREVRPHGAELTLLSGTLAVDVVHVDESRWNVQAGPFGVRVTGTRFDATWEPETGALTIAMTEGTVRVSGPCVDESLSAPSRKTFVCGATALAGAASSASPPTGPASPTASVLAEPSQAIPPGAPAAAENRAPTTPPENAATLAARADAARLAGDAAGARKLYETVRARYPGTVHAGKAAFLLGRIAASAGSNDEAARWFRTAASEPGGFQSEALGRLLELEQSRGRTDEARALAAEYLKRYPSGAFAAYASSVADARATP